MPEYTRRDLSDEAFKMLGEQFKALSEPMRLKLVYALMAGEKSVSELVKETGALQANVSKHLRMLLETGIVGRRKQDLNPFYTIADKSVFKLCDLMCNYIQDRISADLKSFSAPA